LVKRLYIPLPQTEARVQIVSNLLNKQANQISPNDLESIGQRTDGKDFVSLAFSFSRVELTFRAHVQSTQDG